MIEAVGPSAPARASAGDAPAAERALRRALQLDPASVGANFNLGLLLAEQDRIPEVERCFRQVLADDPEYAEAAYSLGVLVARRDLDEAIAWCRRATELNPAEPRYARALATLLRYHGDADPARLPTSKPSRPPE